MPPLLAPRAESSERSLTLAKSSTDRNLEKDYELREELGSGSIGKVYRAIERKTDEAYAVKIIPTRQFAFERSFSVGDLLQEARMLRNVSHPAIVSIRDAYNEDAFLAIVMQLVEGGDLFDRILKRKKYPELDARDVMNYLLSALGYLHARGIAHRDIKPENILLRTENSDVDVLLTDFGLAKGKAVGPHGCKTFCGTPQYLAPEVMECQNGDGVTVGGYDGAAADMWSVGVVLFVLLSGTQPANSRVENKWTTCSFNDSAWESVSQEAKDLICRLTAVDANERPSAAAALLMPWFINKSKRNANIRPPGVGPSDSVKRQRMFDG
jgi:serine/threonine protein kinase